MAIREAVSDGDTGLGEALFGLEMGLSQVGSEVVEAILARHAARQALRDQLGSGDTVQERTDIRSKGRWRSRGELVAIAAATAMRETLPEGASLESSPAFLYGMSGEQRQRVVDTSARIQEIRDARLHESRLGRRPKFPLAALKSGYDTVYKSFRPKPWTPSGLVDAYEEGYAEAALGLRIPDDPASGARFLKKAPRLLRGVILPACDGKPAEGAEDSSESVVSLRLPRLVTTDGAVLPLTLDVKSKKLVLPMSVVSLRQLGRLQVARAPEPVEAGDAELVYQVYMDEKYAPKLLVV